MEINPVNNHNSFEDKQTHSNLDNKPSWEYRLFVRDLELDNAPDEEELNPLGSEGWEMVGIIVHANMLYCYFKREK